MDPDCAQTVDLCKIDNKIAKPLNVPRGQVGLCVSV